MEVLYTHSDAIHNTTAAEIVAPIVLRYVPACKSVLDIGCGTGTWLSVFHETHRVPNVLGVDGEYVDRGKLLIPSKDFIAHDLRKPLRLNRQFDLLLCLEVAEHLPEDAADTLVDTLCFHSEIILFSSAIPGQGGQNHLNERWPGYWKEKFESRRYQRIDLVRPMIWDNSDIDVWYRQNLFVFSNNDDLIRKHEKSPVEAEIHPDLWLERMNDLRNLQVEVNGFEKGDAGVMRSFRALANALRNRLKK